MIYLDYAADTPVSERVLNAFYDAAKMHIANPNSTHPLGVKERLLHEDASARIARRLGVLPDEIVYTSGASESNNLAIKGIAGQYKKYGKHIIATMLEHASVLGPLEQLRAQGFEVDYVRLSRNGHVDMEHLAALVRDDTILVTLSLVDSEIGIMQDMVPIVDLLKPLAHCHLHVDAAQAMGKLPFSLDGIDLLTAAPHKFYGLAGSGLLVVKQGVLLEGQILGGQSTTAMRSGTPSAASALACAVALEDTLDALPSRYEYVKNLCDKLRAGLCWVDGVTINTPEDASPFILNISVLGLKPQAALQALGEQGVCIASKSACCAPNSLSRPVYAVTGDRKRAMSTLRISLSHLTTEWELDEFLHMFKEYLRTL